MELSEARPPPLVSLALPFPSLFTSDEDTSSTGPQTDPCVIEDDLPFELLLEVISYLTSARDLLAASQVCWRWNYAATSPSSWESVSKRSIAFAYSRKAITSAYQGDWKGFFMEHRRLSTSLLMVIPNVNAVSLGSGGYFREQFQLDGLGWSVVLLVRALQPAGQLVSIRLLPNADNGAVSVSFTVRVLSSSAAGSTCSRAQHVFIDHTPLEVQLPLNSAQLSDPTRGFLGGDRIRVAVNVETLEQKVAKQAQELLSAMEKWTARGFTAERVMEVLTLSARGDWLSESLTRSLNPTSLQ